MADDTRVAARGCLPPPVCRGELAQGGVYHRSWHGDIYHRPSAPVLEPGSRERERERKRKGNEERAVRRRVRGEPGEREKERERERERERRETERERIERESIPPYSPGGPRDCMLRANDYGAADIRHKT